MYLVKLVCSTCKFKLVPSEIIKLTNCKTGSEVLAYFSILSGPILAGACGAILCLVPIHNVMKYPSYWYEDQIIRVVAILILSMLNNLYKVEYWSNFRFKDSWKSYLILVGLGLIVYLCATSIYFYIWTYHYGYYQPMPFNGHVVTTPVIIAINAAIIPR